MSDASPHNVLIKSAQDGTTLELYDRTQWDFAVRLSGPNFHASASIYDPETKHLRQFFVEMADNSRGWSGARQWSSMERELALSAKMDSTGHVQLSVEIHSRQHGFGWSLACVLILEAGQLDSIAESIREFVVR